MSGQGRKESFSDAHISFHLWYQSASVTRVEWDFRRDRERKKKEAIFERAESWTRPIRRSVCGCVIHSDIHAASSPALTLSQTHVTTEHTHAPTKINTQGKHPRTRCHSTTADKTDGKCFPFKRISIAIHQANTAVFCCTAGRSRASSIFQTTLLMPKKLPTDPTLLTLSWTRNTPTKELVLHLSDLWSDAQLQSCDCLVLLLQFYPSLTGVFPLQQLLHSQLSREGRGWGSLNRLSWGFFHFFFLHFICSGCLKSYSLLPPWVCNRYHGTLCVVLGFANKFDSSWLLAPCLICCCSLFFFLLNPFY